MLSALCRRKVDQDWKHLIWSNHYKKWFTVTICCPDMYNITTTSGRSSIWIICLSIASHGNDFLSFCMWSWNQWFHFGSRYFLFLVVNLCKFFLASWQTDKSCPESDTWRGPSKLCTGPSCSITLVLTFKAFTNNTLLGFGNWFLVFFLKILECVSLSIFLQGHVWKHEI